jgi:OmcA/MtrC family decaheme c-type cytochrome
VGLALDREPEDFSSCQRRDWRDVVKNSQAPFPSAGRIALVFALAALLGACSGSDGSDGKDGAPGEIIPPKTPTVLSRGENSPGVNVAILSLSGAGNSDGSFKVGDRPSVTFTLKKDDGSTWDIKEMSRARVLMSGPTSNYQRVIAEQSDVATAAVKNADGSYTYTFSSANAIPSTYLAPLNDSSSFGPDDGELKGEPLASGTYTIGLYCVWNYTVEDVDYESASNATVDVLFDHATTLDPRELVTQANCNACHSDLQAHGGMRKLTALCVLCHTAGSEDKNVPSVENGTPGVTVDLKVMIHKIHNAEHLPSVLGIGTNPDGSRTYAAPKQPYLVVGFNNSVNDFSEIAFPVWPNLNIAMPRNQGYSLLAPTDQATDDVMRMGVTACAKCHGDPDGAGPLPPPAQGDLAYATPTRAVCGSCHDDVIWDQPYVKNGQTMPPQSDDSNCTVCHGVSGTALTVTEAHLHPLLDPVVNPGFNVSGLSVAESGSNNGNGKIDPGEQVALTFSLTDDLGNAVAPSTVTSLSVLLSGPTSNYNLILNASVPTAMLTGSPPYTVNAAEVLNLEFLGDAADDGSIEVFTTARHPHYTGTTTTVFERTATSGGSSTLASASTAAQNWLDVVDATGFAHNDYVVIEDGVGGLEEYLRVQGVSGTRLWFGSNASTSYAPGPRFAHAAGATVKEVTLTTKSSSTDYTLDAVNGTITEKNVSSFKAGDAVIGSYTSTFVMPSTYALTLNESPDLDESWGKWTGKSIAPGTYTIAVYGAPNRVVNLWGETQTYRGTSPPASADFLVGTATTLEHYGLVAGAAACNACHDDLYFHGGGRRGFDTCIVCHGGAGTEDRSQYVAANAPATTGNTINFRTMLHKVHMGADLDHATTYEVVGFGSAAWPDNYGIAEYSTVEFPPMPSGAMTCVACHGEGNTAWYDPTPRNHPTQQVKPTRAWRAACGACHDSDAAGAHIDVNTSSSGAESCEVCHGSDGEFAVQLMHKVR